MRIDDGIFVQLSAYAQQLSRLLLRTREVEELIVPPHQRRQVGKDSYLLLTIGVMRDRRAVHQDHVAIIDAQISVEHAANDPVARTEALDPYCFLFAGIVELGGALRQRPLGKSHLAL